MRPQEHKAVQLEICRDSAPDAADLQFMVDQLLKTTNHQKVKMTVDADDMTILLTGSIGAIHDSIAGLVSPPGKVVGIRHIIPENRKPALADKHGLRIAPGTVQGDSAVAS